ncbi:hypothetical protein JCM1841_006248 [Sporobolomyces salmonicolor]
MAHQLLPPPSSLDSAKAIVQAFDAVDNARRGLTAPVVALVLPTPSLSTSASDLVHTPASTTTPSNGGWDARPPAALSGAASRASLHGGPGPSNTVGFGGGFDGAFAGGSGVACHTASPFFAPPPEHGGSDYGSLPPPGWFRPQTSSGVGSGRALPPYNWRASGGSGGSGFPPEGMVWSMREADALPVPPLPGPGSLGGAMPGGQCDPAPGDGGQ